MGSNAMRMSGAPAPRKQSAATDQPQAASVPTETSVSIVAVPCLRASPGTAVERQTGPQHHRRGEREREPLPVVELQRGDHGHRQHGDGRQRGEHEPPAERTRVVGRRRVLAREPGPVAGGLDRGHELARVDARGVEVHARALGRVVDGRLDAVEPVQAALDPARAGGAGHALDGEVETVRDGRRRAHATSRSYTTPLGYTWSLLCARRAARARAARTGRPTAGRGTTSA